MKKREIESILLVNKYLLYCDAHKSLVRSYLTHKVSKALKSRGQKKFSIFSLIIF
jgi:hypothetical protein